jgi:hypothetical protein
MTNPPPPPPQAPKNSFELEVFKNALGTADYAFTDNTEVTGRARPWQRTPVGASSK